MLSKVMLSKVRLSKASRLSKVRLLVRKFCIGNECIENIDLANKKHNLKRIKTNFFLKILNFSFDFVGIVQSSANVVDVVVHRSNRFSGKKFARIFQPRKLSLKFLGFGQTENIANKLMKTKEICILLFFS